MADDSNSAMTAVIAIVAIIAIVIILFFLFGRSAGTGPPTGGGAGINVNLPTGGGTTGQ